MALTVGCVHTAGVCDCDGTAPHKLAAGTKPEPIKEMPKETPKDKDKDRRSSTPPSRRRTSDQGRWGGEVASFSPPHHLFLPRLSSSAFAEQAWAASHVGNSPGSNVDQASVAFGRRFRRKRCLACERPQAVFGWIRRYEPSGNSSAPSTLPPPAIPYVDSRPTPARRTRKRQTGLERGG